VGEFLGLKERISLEVFKREVTPVFSHINGKLLPRPFE